MRCEGKIVLVTGAQRGIGRAVALRFAREGAHVALNFLDDKPAAEAAAAEIAALGRRCSTIGADVSKPGRRGVSWPRSSAAWGRSTCW